MTDDENKDVTGDAPNADESSAAVEITDSTAELNDAPADADAAENADDADETDALGEDADGSARRANRRVVLLVSAIAVAIALVASGATAGWLYFKEYRNDQQTDTAAAKVALDAAKNGTVALLSYSPETLDKDFSAAKQNLTGDFLSYYTQFTEQIVTPAAKEKQVKTTAQVVRAGISEIHPDSAVALVFINQVTTSKENPDGAFAASSVKVSMKKIDGRWLINQFDPV